MLCQVEYALTAYAIYDSIPSIEKGFIGGNRQSPLKTRREQARIRSSARLIVRLAASESKVSHMVCHNCKIAAVKAGKDKKGNQRFKCQRCKRRFQELRDKLLGNMYLPEDKALQILQMLVEGNSIRSIERITGVEKKTILSLLALAGERCEDLMRRYMRTVKCSDLHLMRSGHFVE